MFLTPFLTPNPFHLTSLSPQYLPYISLLLSVYLHLSSSSLYVHLALSIFTLHFFLIGLLTFYTFAQLVCSWERADRASIKKEKQIKVGLGAGLLLVPPHTNSALHPWSTHRHIHNMPGEITWRQGDESQAEKHLVTNLIQDIWLTLAHIDE